MAIAESLDHFVVPVDDLVVAEEFYVRVFGGVITKRNGLNVRQRKRGAVPHTFIQIGGKRMGVYLQSDHRPEPSGARGLPTYSFTTTAQGLAALVEDLHQLSVRFEGPVTNANSFADQSLFFTDPAGNHYAVFTPKDSTARSNTATGRMTGVGYIELEAPSVEASIAFYEKVLGFEVQSRRADPGQAIAENGQRPNSDFDRGAICLQRPGDEPQGAGTAYRFLRSRREMVGRPRVFGPVGNRKWRPRRG